MQRFYGSAAKALIAALLVVSAAPRGVSAQSAGAEPVAFATRDVGPLDDIVEGLFQAGSADEHAALWSMFSRVAGDPEAVATLAVNLLDTLEGDPVAVSDAARMIVTVAEEALFAQPVVRVSVDDQFTLPPGTVGWDFGPPDAPLFPGFQRVAPGDPGFAGERLEGLRREAGEGLLSDGVAGVSRFSTRVPDGVYRLIILTDDLGDRASAHQPLGATIVVNGNPVRIVRGQPAEWLSSGELLNPQGQSIPAAHQGGEGGGGAVVLTVSVTDGTLTIEFQFADGGSSYVTAAILEPVDQPTVLQLPFEQASIEDIAFAEAMIAENMALLLETIAQTAAGPQERAQILSIAGLTFENTGTVSED